ncbi:MAG: hypothetical protein H0T47_19495 [Planctomycetaceae bacterium]|nr:hypothetical protein [Planctomycetaceae bacterium]
MDRFFAHKGVRLIESRPWSGNATRSWFTLAKALSRDEIAALLAELPAGASVQFFDIEHPEISDPGAFVTITRRPEEWTAE